MEHENWYRAATGDDSVNGAARRAGIVQRTLARQLERGVVSAENVISIAVAYGYHPVGALVDTGYLDEKWAQQIDPTYAARELTDQQLCDEFLRRLKLPAPSSAFDTPMDELQRERYPDYLEMVANEDDEELGDDHDYTP